MQMFQKFQDILQDRAPLRRLSAAIIGRTGLGRRLHLKIQVQDYQIHFHPTGLCSAYCYNPAMREEDYNFLTTYLRSGDVYLDVGANIGATVIPAAKTVGNQGRVVAFEPHPRIYSYLLENITLNGLTNVDAHNLALGNQSGEIYFTDEFMDDTNHVSTEPLPGSLKVQAVVLDQITAELANIALLKIDVEGYERFVLEGAEATLEKSQCLYFEVVERNFRDFGYSTPDLLRYITERGFQLYRRHSNSNQLIEIDTRYMTAASEYENLFGIKNIAEFCDRTGWQVVSQNVLMSA
jgi:FkbM family methyltransferase